MKLDQAEAINNVYLSQRRAIEEQHDRSMQATQERMQSLLDMFHRKAPPSNPDILQRLEQLEAEVRDLRGLPPRPTINTDPIFGSKT